MTKIREHIVFNDFNSKELGLYLLERAAPTPSEKENIENIPFRQGVVDFSMHLGERIFNNREITYEFQAFSKSYQTRKELEQEVKRRAMVHGESILYDTHDLGFHWFGKCESVEVTDNSSDRYLKIKMVFNCYPFMLSEKRYFDDIWDDFNLESGVASWTKYRIQGRRQIRLFNLGEIAISPEVVVNGNITIETPSGTYRLRTGTHKDHFLKLERGMNVFYADGNGSVAFHFRSEVMG